MWSRGELVAFLETVRDDGMLFAALWCARRWKLAKALGQHAWDVEAIEKLSALLGHSVELKERDVVCKGCHVAERLDQLLTSELCLATGLLTSQEMVMELCRAWLLLEIRFVPDEPSWIQVLRERLAVHAESLEIDLRGLGV